MYKVYTVEKVIYIPVFRRDVKLSLGGNDLIIPAQGEFGK
jgi:hypothetical protein